MSFFYIRQAFLEKILTSFPLKIRLRYVKNFAVIAGAKVHPFSSCASFLSIFF